MPRFTLSLDRSGSSHVAGSVRRRPVFLGETADEANAAVEAQQTEFKKKMKAEAIKVAAFQTGVSIALMCIPVVGWAAAAVFALLQVFASSHVKKEIKSIMESTQRDIAAKNKSVQKSVHAEEDRVADEVYPDAQALALSGAPLEGLGSLWTSITGSVKKAAHQTAKVVVKAHTVPVNAAVKGTLKATAGVLSAVGAKKLATHVEGDAERFNRLSKKFDTRLTAELGDPKVMAKDIIAEHIKAKNLMTGDAQIIKAREQAAKLKSKAFTALDKAHGEAIANTQTDAYRQTLTKTLAKSIRGDPKLMDEARFYQAQEQMHAAQKGLPAGTVVPTVDTGGKGIVGIAAAAAAFFLLRH